MSGRSGRPRRPGHAVRRISIVFSYGFRPFFVLCAAHAIVLPALWLLALNGARWPGAPQDLVRWHAHEMLVGFVGAAESKAALIETAHGVPYLTLRGRRGGSALAAAAVNALAAPETPAP